MRRLALAALVVLTLLPIGSSVRADGNVERVERALNAAELDDAKSEIESLRAADPARASLYEGRLAMAKGEYGKAVSAAEAAKKAAKKDAKLVAEAAALKG